MKSLSQEKLSLDLILTSWTLRTWIWLVKLVFEGLLKKENCKTVRVFLELDQSTCTTWLTTSLRLDGMGIVNRYSKDDTDHE